MSNSWEIIKKNFSISFTIEMTSMKVMAWVLLIFMWTTIGSLPDDAKAFYGITITGIIAAMYGVKAWEQSIVNKDFKQKSDAK